LKSVSKSLLQIKKSELRAISWFDGVYLERSRKAHHEASQWLGFVKVATHFILSEVEG
jgi:hypothetical protein